MTLCGWKIFSRNKQKLNHNINKNNDSNLEIVPNLTENINENILLDDYAKNLPCDAVNIVANQTTNQSLIEESKICDNGNSSKTKPPSGGIFKKHFSYDLFTFRKYLIPDGSTSYNNNKKNFKNKKDKKKKLKKNDILEFGPSESEDNFDEFLLACDSGEFLEVNFVKNSKDLIKKKSPQPSIKNNNDNKNVNGAAGVSKNSNDGVVKKYFKTKNYVVNGDDDDFDDEKNISNIDVDEGNPRNKCALKPGHSLMDWIRLGTSGVDLAGTRGIITPVNTVELGKHCKLDDAWIAIRGKVYNVTKYMDFHPGGPDELIKGVGTDATKMFDDIHAWVNYEQLLAKCYIGPLTNIVTIDLEPMKPRQKSTTPTPDSSGSLLLQSDIDSDSFKRPKNLPIRLSSSEKTSPIKGSPEHIINLDNTNNIKQSDNSRLNDFSKIIPRFDWIQKTGELSLIFYTKPFCNPCVIVQLNNPNEILIRILIDSQTHSFHFQFQHTINWPCTIRVACETGKVEIICCKMIPELWTAYGQMNRESNHTIYNDSSDNTIDCDSDNYFAFEIDQCIQINHDSYALELRPHNNNKIIVIPIGYHISLSAFVNGEYVTRSYTPVPVSYVPFVSSNIANIFMLIKSYSMGMLAKHITSINISGAENLLKISLPKGNFQLTKLLDHRKFGLLAAGSGITPILGVLDHLLARMNNKIEHIELMLFNKTEEDIWSRDKLEQIAKKDIRLTIRHILSEPEDSWTGEIGRVSESILLPLTDETSHSQVTFCCICGPMQFNDLSLKLLLQIGFMPEQIHFFQG